MREPNHEDFYHIAMEAYGRLPTPFRKLADDITIRVEDFAEPEVLADLDIPDAFNLLGLYHGVDVTRKSLWDLNVQNDMIFLYRKPILNMARHSSDTLEHIIEHVLIHEIGHHFGLSDDDMHALEDEADGEEMD
ncbi:metallopeptidase family protein [Aquisalinus flavus]|nr:metallopeptidase family protein [Aquisalinus flavus]MBD0427214.1 metallopeptidase family protein [Aquisalinus flavus]UNE47029.1 metallopeptidase family protein [Aquisalinus flavus]